MSDMASLLKILQQMQQPQTLAKMPASMDFGGHAAGSAFDGTQQSLYSKFVHPQSAQPNATMTPGAIPGIQTPASGFAPSSGPGGASSGKGGLAGMIGKMG